MRPEKIGTAKQLCRFYIIPSLCVCQEIFVPPHSTTVKPVRTGAVSAWAGSFTKESELCQAMNTRIRVSGAGSMCSPAAWV